MLLLGGGANAKQVEEAFKLLQSDPNVRGLLVNIFGGIMRCDIIANGILEAIKQLGGIKIPIVARLSGTNSEQGKKILNESGLKFVTAEDLDELAKKAVAQLEIVHTKK